MKNVPRAIQNPKKQESLVKVESPDDFPYEGNFNSEISTKNHTTEDSIESTNHSNDLNSTLSK